MEARLRSVRIRHPVGRARQRVRGRPTGPGGSRAAAATALLALAGPVLSACTSSPSNATGSPHQSHRTAPPHHDDQVGSYGVLPGAGSGRKLSGGVVSIAEAPGEGPDYILPITPEASTSVYDINQFQCYMWRPLWWGPLGETPTLDYSQSIARAAVFSNHDKTVTITLNRGWKWSDGQPVTAQDVLFDLDLTGAAVKLSPRNYGSYTAGLYPDFVTGMSAPNPSTVVLDLDRSYNRDFLALDELPLIVPLPAHAWATEAASGAALPESAWFDPDPSSGANLRTDQAIYTFLNGQSKDLATYASNPLWQVVDGPFHLKSFDVATDGNTMVPNPNYSGPVKPSIAELENVAFTSTAQEFNQLLSGNLTVGYVDPTDLLQAKALEADGYEIWRYPDFGFTYVVYNFKDQTAHFADIIKQLYLRQALAHLQDEPAMISSKLTFDGAAVPSYGPVPSAPASPFAPSDALTNPYPFSILAAASILRAHGWKVVPRGTTTCARPGTASDECGAGVARGWALSWDLVDGSSPAIQAEVAAFASNAKQVGIDINVVPFPDTIVSNVVSDVGNSNDNGRAMQAFGGFTDSDYPTTNQLFSTTGSFNIGGYSDPKADALIDGSITSPDVAAVTNEVSYLTQQQPALFQPEPDVVVAVNDHLHGPPNSFADASQYQFSPEYWYFV
jgi:peptide/nickel transport system substrate-binding protein